MIRNPSDIAKSLHNGLQTANFVNISDKKAKRGTSKRISRQPNLDRAIKSRHQHSNENLPITKASF